MPWIKQSTAVDIGIGPFLDATDGNTPETALTITAPDIRLKKNGGAFAQKNAAQTLTHEEAGWYEVALDATDTNTLGILIIAIHESGALPVWKEYMVVPANVYDSMVLGSDKLEVDVDRVWAALVDEDSIGNPWSADAFGFALKNISSAAPSNWLSATGIATDAGTEIATAVWALATRTLSATQTFNNTGTWTGNLSGSVGSVTAIVTANTTQVSGDSVAADNLETMLDGTGGQTLTLKSLVINNAAGIGLSITGSTIGTQIVGTSGTGLVLSGGTYGLNATGVTAGLRADCAGTGPGLECVGSGATGSGALFSGAGSGAGLEAVGGDTGDGIEAIGGTGSGAGLHVRADVSGNGLLAEGVGAADISGDITGNITGSLTGSVGSVTSLGTSAIAASSFAPGAINAAAIAADAIGASELATSAVSEIVAGIGGVGAFAITVTVNDGAAALQNVDVSIWDGGGALAGRNTTDASGNASFSLAAGTYTVALVKANYNFAPVSRTVTGNQAGSLVTALSMTIIAPIVASGTPGMCVVAGYIKDANGAVLVSSTVVAKIVPSSADRPITSDGVVVSLEPVEATTNGVGLVSMELIRTDELDQTCTYTISCADADMDVKGITLAAATKDIATL